MIIDGKKISEKILNSIEIKKQLKLAVVLVGDDPNSKIYVRKKGEACQRVGIDFQLSKFPADISKEDLVKKINDIVQDGSISGIVIQLPLPKQINADEIMKLIPEEKDVEGFVSSRVSPVVCAIEHILEEYNISLESKKIALIGRGVLVGLPVSKWLDKKGIKYSDNTKEADLIISGVGKPNLIKEDMVKEGVIIIDVGGDVDPEVSKKASYITPIIGGVGPITVACLIKSLVYGSTNI